MEISNSVIESGAGPTDLDAAVEAAMPEVFAVVDLLSEKVLGALDHCVKRSESALEGHGDRPGRAVIDSYADLLRDRKADADRRFDRQRARLGTFNLVLFGRTGAGKSSLIEALSSGNGEPISRSESDWTTDVRDVRWRGSRLFDTPGIGGWGRTVARAELEARAEAAVADADVVVLCFDTQSQQDGEFSKIAEWVSRYGKPVVAVLNSRNARWRNPARVGQQARRSDLSRTVHEHAGNIRDELDLVGLHDVPVIAIHTKRAAFARTTDPYAGPDANGRRKQRDEFGAERLLEWSNLPALESLLAEALSNHAVPLRLGMLHEQAGGLLADTAAAAGAAGAEAAVFAEQLERGIGDVLALIGRPTDKQLSREIKRLEKLRGGFGSDGPGEILRHARYRLTVGLGRARTEAFRQAERLVEDAFEDRDDLGNEEFDEKVLAPARVAAQDVGRTVGRELQDYLARRLELIADDVRADLDAAVHSFEGADTKAGRAARAIGLALETGSGLLSVGSGGVLLAAALANSWNPGGWVLGAVIAGGVLMTYVGGKLRKKGTRDRVGALSDARARARRSVDDTFDEIERTIAEDFNRILSQAAHEQLADDVAQALALRTVSKVASVAVDTLQKTKDQHPEVGDSSRLLPEIARELQRRRYPGEPTGERLLWLGESWCNDPEGLIEADAATDVPTTTRDSATAERLVTQVRSVTHTARQIPPAGASVEWAARARGHLTGDDDALRILDQTSALAVDTPPRIVIAGDYSTGKSSFIKRLLIDSGLLIPDALSVAAHPQTDRAATYRIGPWELVDTPGFQSSRAGHADAAHDAIVGASLLIVLFNPNLVVGATTDLASILLGGSTIGRVGKLPRTLFVVNRSDELGVDPQEDPTGYQTLCERKQLELVQALNALLSRSHGDRDTVSIDQVVCVASDPYGLVGDRDDAKPADFNEHRDWDGMDAIRIALTEASGALASNSLDTQVLDRSTAALGDLIAERHHRHIQLQAAITQSRHLLLDLDTCLAGGHAIRDAARDRLITDFANIVGRMFDDAQSAQEPGTQDAMARRLERWSDDPEVQQAYREWAKRFGRQFDEWQAATSARIDARLTSAAYQAAFPDTDVVLVVDHLKPVVEPVVKDAATSGAKEAAKAVSKMSRETVTKLAHKVGHKFKPWGATKLTTKINAAGGAFGVAFGAIELYSTWRSTQEEAATERTAQERRSAGLQQIREAAAVYFDSDEPDAPGAQINESIQAVERERDAAAETLTSNTAEATRLAQQIEQCRRSMNDALERLEREVS